MIVAPQSRLCIMRGIPWTNDYKHTRLFNSESQQNEYMTGEVVREFFNFTYIREQNVIRVPASADDLYNCNYLRYMNETFGTKWFYAFITDVKFVNPETAEISFEIDEFQTWWFSVNVGHCYVEREHVADDTIGKHIIDEGLGTGDIVPQVVYNRYWKFVKDSDKTYEHGYDLLMQVKPTLLGQFVSNQQPFSYWSNQITPRTITEQHDTNTGFIDATALNGKLMNGTLTGAEVGDAYMCPTELITAGADVLVDDLASQHNIKRPTEFEWSPSIRSPLNPPYKPKNNKLFTYPYTYLYVTSSEGTSKKYKWENTQDGYLSFQIASSMYNVPSCVLMPRNYVGGLDERLDDIPINEFPKVSLGQYDSFSPKNIANSVLRMGGAALQGNAFGFVSEFANSAIGLATDTTDKDFATVGNSTVIKKQMLGYTFYVMAIHGQNAKVIDDYLTRFGYKVNTIKIPELTSRKRWNFVKTKECEIHAKSNNGAPTSALQRIQDAFNSGITLWHVNDVGNFDGDNGTVS